MWRIVFSTMAAAFGVQSRKNLEVDENNGSVLPYLIAGLIFTAIFVGALIILVKLISN